MDLLLFKIENPVVKKKKIGQVPCYTIADQIHRMRQGDFIAYISVFLKFNL